MIRVGVLTVSDRSARGEREDLGGPAVAAAVLVQLPDAAVAERAIVPDERAAIAAMLAHWADDARSRPDPDHRRHRLCAARRDA